MKKDILFKVKSKLGVEIRTTKRYWKVITTIKHPSIRNKRSQVKQALKEPDIVRRSKSDSQVHLYYRRQNNHYLAVVCKHLNQEGFIITCYLTSKLMEGEQIWQKQKQKQKS